MTDDTPNCSPEPPESKKTIWSILGPWIVTGVSDNDPSGIATYSQAGAKFGYALLWMSLIPFPMLLAVILKIANNKQDLGDKVNGKISNVTSIISAVVFAAAAGAMVAYQWVIG